MPTNIHLPGPPSRNHHRLVARVGGGCLGLLLALGSGCTAGPEPRPDTATATATDEASVLNRHLGFEVDAESELARAVDLDRRVGDLTSACMGELGFRYIHPSGASTTPLPLRYGSGDGPAPYSPEWIAHYGFGVTTLALPQSELGPGLIGHPDPLHDQGDVDPNAAELASLGADEQAEYHRALHGRPGGQIDGVAVEGDPGCLQQATEAVFADERTVEFMEVFGDELDAIEDRVSADPRVVEFRQAVADCVTDAGFAWAPGDDPVERFSARLEELLDIAGALPEDREPALAELQAEELALASAVLECGGDPVSEQRFVTRVRNEYEQDFLDRNADRVAAYAVPDPPGDPVGDA